MIGQLTKMGPKERINIIERMIYVHILDVVLKYVDRQELVINRSIKILIRMKKLFCL